MSVFKRALSLLALSAATVTLFSCSGVAPAVKPLTAERPVDAPFRTELKKEISTLNVPIEASSETLARTLNQVVGRDLYKGSTRYSGVTADLIRSGPIAVTAAEDYLYLTLPVSISLRYGFFESPGIASKLKFRIAAKVTPDWKIKADVSYLGLSDLFADQISIGPLSMKPRSVIEGMTQPVQKLLSDTVSSKINEAFPVKAQVAKVWNAAQKPVLLDKRFNAWLRITPRQVMLYPFYARNNKIQLNVGITSIAEVVVGPQPATPPPVPLPNLVLLDGTDSSFRIAVNADLFYRDILDIASPLLLDKDFGSDGKSIILKQIDLYGNGDRLVIKVVTTGSLEGVFYLTCKPGFDTKTNMFSVQDVDFDMHSQDLLLRSADWFLHGTIRNAIQEKLNVDLTQRLEESRGMAQKAMAQVKLMENVFLKGTIDNMKVNDVVVQKDKMSIQLYTEGKTAVIFQ